MSTGAIKSNTDPIWNDRLSSLRDAIERSPNNGAFDDARANAVVVIAAIKRSAAA